MKNKTQDRKWGKGRTENWYCNVQKRAISSVSGPKTGTKNAIFHPSQDRYPVTSIYLAKGREVSSIGENITVQGCKHIWPAQISNENPRTTS